MSEEGKPDTLAETTKRLAYKYMVISDRDPPVVVACAAAEVLGAALPQVRLNSPELFSDLIRWLRDGLDHIEKAEVRK
jgi:hypothetical protein